MAWREKSVIKGERTSVLESVTARDCSWIKERKGVAIGVSHCDLLQEGMHLPSLEVAVTISSFNNIFLILWPWTSTYDLGCQASPTQGQGIPSRQMTRPEVISLWPLTSGQLRTLAAWATPLFVTDVWDKIIRLSVKTAALYAEPVYTYSQRSLICVTEWNVDFCSSRPQHVRHWNGTFPDQSVDTHTRTLPFSRESAR